MKKIILFMVIVLLTGCSNSEEEVNNPDGSSLTYSFFEEYDYDDAYTLILKNGSDEIIIAKDGYEVYYHSSSQTIIEKDHKKYTIDELNYTYTVENISSYDDFAYGYLPDTSDIRDQSYTKGKEWRGITRYIYETYVYDGVSTTYYFKGSKLVKIKSVTALTETEVSFVSVDGDVDEDLFDIPEGYTENSY